VSGCLKDDDCLRGTVCKSLGGMQPMMSYTKAQCRALPSKTDPTEVGVCCNAGCTGRVECSYGQFCCGEPNSPYSDPASCLTTTATSGVMAQAGDCFDMPASTFCHTCDPTMPSAMQCNSGTSGWNGGLDTDPAVNGGMPFREQEWCSTVSQMPMKAFCTVTCNPFGADNGCPPGWMCSAVSYPCMTDSDCGGTGLTCDGANMAMMIPGKCQCGTGSAMATCPMMTGMLGDPIAHGRCEKLGTSGKFYCVASFDCFPPQLTSQFYPPICLH
jgi:hypothetical protein